MSINPTYNHYDMKQKVGVSNLKLLDGEDLSMLNIIIFQLLVIEENYSNCK